MDVTPTEALRSVDLSPNETLLSMALVSNDSLLSIAVCETLLAAAAIDGTLMMMMMLMMMIMVMMTFFFAHGIRREENHARDVQQSAERPQARDVQQAEGVLLNSFHRIMRQLPKGEKETARASLACWGSDMVSSPLKAKAAAWETATLQEPLQSRAVVVKNMRSPLVSTTVSPVSGDAHQKPAG